MKQSFYTGFVKRACEYGMTETEATYVLKQAGGFLARNGLAHRAMNAIGLAKYPPVGPGPIDNAISSIKGMMPTVQVLPGGMPSLSVAGKQLPMLQNTPPPAQPPPAQPPTVPTFQTPATPSGPTPEQLAWFRKETGTNFNAKSIADTKYLTNRFSGMNEGAAGMAEKARTHGSASQNLAAVSQMQPQMNKMLAGGGTPGAPAPHSVMPPVTPGFKLMDPTLIHMPPLPRHD